MRITRIICASTLLAGLLFTVNLAIAAEPPSSAGPWIGAWKTNPAKTAAANGKPAPTGPQMTRIFRMVQLGKDAFYFVIESGPAGQKPVPFAALIGRFDGKPYLEIGNPIGADSNKFRIVDDHTYEITDMKDGKDILTLTVSISADGKTRTSTTITKDAQGKETKNLSVSDRIDE